MKIYNKLIRDKIPEIIEKAGKQYTLHTASEEMFEQKLLEKLLEESNELIEKPCIEEIADIYEVLDAIIRFYGFDDKEIETVKASKRLERGGFDQQLILEKVYEV